MRRARIDLARVAVEIQRRPGVRLNSLGQETRSRPRYCAIGSQILSGGDDPHRKAQCEFHGANGLPDKFAADFEPESCRIVGKEFLRIPRMVYSSWTRETSMSRASCSRTGHTTGPRLNGSAGSSVAARESCSWAHTLGHGWSP